MSTIKSSDEHLTINADGSGKDIKFQANGVEKASISSAGAFTSTTIDATKLTGDLPAISGANLTGVGVAGITSSADATAITIDSNENVGIGTSSPQNKFHVLASSAGQTVAKFESNQAGALAVEIDADADRDSFFRFQEAGTTRWDFYSQGSSGGNELNIRNQSGTNLIQFKQDGRGLSEFTAKAWCRFNGGGTPSFSDSFNCSSLGDWATGNYGIYMTSGVGNGNYAVLCLVNDAKYGSLDTSNTAPQGGRFDIEVRTVDSNFSAEDVGYVSCLVFGD